MGRRASDSPRPDQKPAEKVELSEKHIGRRAIAAAVFLLIALGAFTYFILNLVRGEPGWTQITALSSKVSCSGDFVFLYELGTEGGSAQSERRSVTATYTAAAQKAYWMFENVRGTGEEVSSVRYLNDHPNEEVTVDEPLYEAFARLEAAGNRCLYLPAVYREYDNLFASQSDLMAAEFDPRVNGEAAAYVQEVLAYANDPKSVNLELLGEGRVRLFVSREYLAYAQENGIDSFIDFYWMKNAFVADYLAESLIEAGYTRGSISSYDGFVRNLDGRDVSYSFNLYDRVAPGEDALREETGDEAGQGQGPDEIGQAQQTDGTGQAQGLDGAGTDAQILRLATLQYKGPASLVYLRDYPMTSMDQRYYRMADGQMRTAYIDPKDGLCHSSLGSLVSYSYSSTLGCADVLLSVLPVYMADAFDPEAAEALAEGGESADGRAGAIYSVYRQGSVIRVNDPQAQLTAVCEGYEIQSPAKGSGDR